MSEVFVQSWETEEQLEELARLKRNEEIVRGTVISTATKRTKVLEDNKYVEKQMEVAEFWLPGGIKAYCPEHEFSDYKYKSLQGFTGTIQEFVIHSIDLENKIAIVSVKRADEIKREKFFKEIEELQESGDLRDKTYEGVVWGVNPKTRRIHVRVNGTDCFMLPNDWSWDRSINVETDVQRGETVEVKVLRFDKESGLVQVSRRHTMEDPFKKLERMKDNLVSVAGVVSGVDPIHGIFVKLDSGLEVKGIKPAHLEEPVVGDIVACVIRSVNRKERKARVVITGYPRGKKKRKDLGAFLFE